MNLGTQAEIIEVALACAVGVGAVGLAISWLLRDRSLRWQLTLIGLFAVAAPYAGLVAVTQRMFLSEHDLTVAMYVSSVSAVVSLLAVLALGAVVGRWTDQILNRVRTFNHETDVAPFRGPREFRAMADELGVAKQDLAASRDREAAMDRSRRDLVSWVSHDLRTPLAGLRAMTEALEDGMAPDPARYLAQMRGNLDRMTLMVDDLLELSRIHAGALPSRVEPLLLRDLVSEAIASADAHAHTRGVSLGGSVPDDLTVLADPAALARAFSNLLINAIRHTPAGGAVEMTAVPSGSGIDISVVDACGGIPDNDLPHVFEVGWQGSVARSPSGSAVGRAGLGLAIVRGIVDAHGGEVGVANLTPATGCCFVVSLPRA